MSGNWLTEREVEERYGFAKSSLELWRTYGCLALAGAKPRVRAKRRYGEPNLYHRGDMEKIAAVPSTNGRIESRKGVWLSTEVAFAEYGTSRAVLTNARRTPTPLLGGATLTAKRFLTIAGGGTRGWRFLYVWFYLEDDVAELAAKKAANERCVQDDDEWLTASEVRERFGFNKHLLYHWRAQRCIHLDDRPLTALPRKVRKNGELRTLWTYSAKDLEAIQSRLAAPPVGIIEDQGGKWFSLDYLRRTHKLQGSTLSYWRKKRWFFRPDGSFRAKQIPTPAGKASAHRKLWVYHAEDVQQALAAVDARTRAGRRNKDRTVPIDQVYGYGDSNQRSTNVPFHAGSTGGGLNTDRSNDTPEAEQETPPRRRGRPEGSNDREVQERNAQILQDRMNGLSVTELARKYDVSRATVYLALEHAGAPG